MPKLPTFTGIKAQPLPGVPHFPKLPTTPKPRQNALNVRVGPIKRLTAQEQPEKPDIDLS